MHTYVHKVELSIGTSYLMQTHETFSVKLNFVKRCIKYFKAIALYL